MQQQPVPQPDLPTGYYKDNFDRLLATVVERYDDLLADEDRDFIAAYQNLSLPSARLLVRLYTRKGPTFRQSKLSYAEIPDLDVAVEELTEAKLLDADPELSAGEVAQLLTLAELRKLDWVPNPKRPKNELLVELADWEEVRCASDWQLDERLIQPQHWLTLRRLQLLYFGNEYQSLTDFVLSDLGLFQYEDYPLGKANRWFEHSDELHHHLLIGELKSAVYEAREAGDVDALAELAEPILQIDWLGSAKPRADRLANRLGFRLEQWGEPELALKLFQTNDQPPARERRCRIHYKAERFVAAQEELDAIRLDPKDATEARFISRFAPRLAKKLKLKIEPIPAPVLSEKNHSWPQGEGSVEQQVCARLDDAYWLENLLPLGVFGLIHWQWIFQPVAGAFHHPFQQAPADLYEPDFLTRRGTSTQQLYGELTEALARQLITENWDAKVGRQNPFVHWGALDKELVLRAFDALPWDHWLAIFRHLWLDLKRHRAGFPDLFQFTKNGGRFIEVKGPGDRLQDNQRDWLAVFEQAGIAAEVWYIRYE
ncbi:VRR-NUC domain-containing protein [Saccharospirillum sp. HFRX-1]|uniref:VRR-NUC domain-containing protein n=1 Tax=unclassified Saccharospirillum TaxID=2633430 RepID=UPI0037227325